MNTICLVLDGLHTGFLGPYGNTWIHTPAFNLLASHAFTFDCALIDSPQIDRLYDSYWHIKHALAPAPDGPSFPTRIRQADLTPVLMSDEPGVLAHPLAADFEKHVRIASPDGPRPIAEELEETHFASCFAQLIDWLDQAPEQFFLWCHLGGLRMVWDAPAEYRTAYAAPDDPEPFLGVEPPRCQLPTDYDPDDLFGIVQAYAGQVTLVDTCLGGLLGMLDETPLGENTALAVLGARGFPLGEHRQVGLDKLPLYGELVHVPAMFCLPDGRGAAARSPELVQPADLSATLLDSVGASCAGVKGGASLLPLLRGDADATRPCVLLAGSDNDTSRALRTPAWYFRQGELPELFVKPDDRWEANNVASRCVEVVEQFEAVLPRVAQSAESGCAPQSPQIPDILVSGLE